MAYLDNTEKTMMIDSILQKAYLAKNFSSNLGDDQSRFEQTFHNICRLRLPIVTSSGQ